MRASEICKDARFAVNAMESSRGDMVEHERRYCRAIMQAMILWSDIPSGDTKNGLEAYITRMDIRKNQAVRKSMGLPAKRVPIAVARSD